MELIRNWLSSKQNFYVGAALYKRFGSNQALKDLLTKGATPFNQQLLLKELQKLATGEVKRTVVFQPMETVIEMPASSNKVLAALKEEWLLPYKQMNYLIQQLDRYQGDEPGFRQKRGELAQEILAKEQQCMQVWEKRDYYLQHGKLPHAPGADQKIIPTDPSDLGRAIETCKRNIRRNHKKLKDDPTNALHAQRYNEYCDWYEKLTGKKYINE